MYGSVRLPSHEIGTRTGRSVGVDNPLPPAAMRQKRLRDHVSFERDNRMRREFMQEMQRSQHWGVAFKPARKPMTLSEFNNNPPSAIVGRDDIISHIDPNGLVHFTEVEDPHIARALRNNPGATPPVLDFLRRSWAGGTTNVAAPWFATKSAVNTLIGGFLGKRGFKGLGYAHRGVNRYAADTPLANFVNRWVSIDPTIPLAVAVQAAKNINGFAIKAFGEAAARDLAKNSSLLRRFDQATGGHHIMETAGQNAILAYRNSDIQFLIKHGILGQRAVDPHFEMLARGYQGVAKVLNDNPGVIRRGTRMAINGWVNVFDAISNSPNATQAMVSMRQLERKYGAGRVPRTEFDKALHDAKVLGGDMTRSPGNELASQVVNVFPFSGSMVNGNVQYWQHFKMDPMAVGASVFGSVAMPWLAMTYYINTQPDLARWWNNDITPWQRATSMPLPSTEYLMEQAMAALRGEAPRNLTKEDIYLFQPMPELASQMAFVNAFFRHMGVYGDYASYTFRPAAEYGAALRAFLFPPGNPMFALFNGGADMADDRTTHEGLEADSGVVKEAAEMVKAVWGTVADVARSGTQAAAQSYEAEGNRVRGRDARTTVHWLRDREETA